MIRTTTTLLVAALAVIMLGCGGKKENTVIAVVKFSDGTPLDSGQVQIVSPTFETFGAIESGGIVDLGKMDGGVPDGTYKVSVQSFSEGGGQNGSYGTPLVAKKFLTADSSGLTIEVKGDKEIEIVVEKP